MTSDEAYFAGRPGQKIAAVGIVTTCREVRQRRRGQRPFTRYLLVVEASGEHEGVTVRWLASRWPGADRGAKVEVIGLITRHAMYGGVPHTVITRAQVTVLEAAADRVSLSKRGESDPRDGARAMSGGSQAAGTLTPDMRRALHKLRSARPEFGVPVGSDGVPAGTARALERRGLVRIQGAVHLTDAGRVAADDVHAAMQQVLRDAGGMK